MFKNWLQFKSSISTCSSTIPDIPFMKIKHIITKLIVNQKESTASIQLSIGERDSDTIANSSCELIRQTMSIAEQRAASYPRNATNRQTQLIEKTQHSNPSRCIHHILNAINGRQLSMIQRAQYQLQLMLTLTIRERTIRIEKP